MSISIALIEVANQIAATEVSPRLNARHLGFSWWYELNRVQEVWVSASANLVYELNMVEIRMDWSDHLRLVGIVLYVKADTQVVYIRPLKRETYG